MSFFDMVVKAPFLTFIIICSVYYTIKNILNYLKRRIRSKDIQARGWPTLPNMDADGDIVHPEKEGK